MKREIVVRQLMDDFRRIVQALRSSHRAAGRLKLTGAQLFVLKVLGENGEPMSINELGDATETTQSTVSAVTARLIDRGLITSERSPEDARRARVALTMKGRTVFRRAPATVAQIRLAQALGELSVRDAAKLLRLLDEIVAKMGLGAEPAKMMFDEEQRK